MRTVDGFQAAENLTRAYTVLLLFLVGVITFQLFSGESLGIVRRRENQPRAYWTILAVQVVGRAQGAVGSFIRVQPPARNPVKEARVIGLPSANGKRP